MSRPLRDELAPQVLDALVAYFGVTCKNERRRVAFLRGTQAD